MARKHKFKKSQKPSPSKEKADAAIGDGVAKPAAAGVPAAPAGRSVSSAMSRYSPKMVAR